MKLFFVKDVVSKRFTMPFIGETAGAGLRANLISICQRLPYSDIEVYEVCDIQLSDDNFEMGPVSLKKIDIEKAYKFPETVAKSIKADEFLANTNNYNIEQGQENRDEVQAPVK